MSELAKYSVNCDYLREKFNKDTNIDMYSLFNLAVDHIKMLEEQIKINNSQMEKEQCKPKSTTKKLNTKKSK